jgi:hypothetical protein
MTKSNAGRKGGPTLTAAIIKMNAEGMTGTAIAGQLGCSSGHVSKILYRNRVEVKAPHRMMDHWKGTTYGKACREWVLTADGLKPCGKPKHTLGGETVGQCEEHYEAQRPLAGKIRSAA